MRAGRYSCAVADDEERRTMFLSYSSILNSFDSAATTKITVNNRRINRDDVEKRILIPLRNDYHDIYRVEYNDMITDKITGSNSMIQDKYVTITICKNNIKEARKYFARVGAELSAKFAKLGSKFVELDASDRLRIAHDFFNAGHESDFRLTVIFVVAALSKELRILEYERNIVLLSSSSATAEFYSCVNTPTTSRTIWWQSSQSLTAIL